MRGWTREQDMWLPLSQSWAVVSFSVVKLMARKEAETKKQKGHLKYNMSNKERDKPALPWRFTTSAER